MLSTDLFGEPLIYAEITVQENMISEALGQRLIALSREWYPETEDVDFRIADNVNVPVAYHWTPYLGLTITEMQINAPASAASVEGVTAMAPTIGELINQANIRECPQVNDDCPVVATLIRGQDGLVGMPINGSVTGQSVNGNSLWYRGSYDGKEVYIHSSLVQLAGSNTMTTSSSNSTNNTASDPTALPRPQNCTQAVEWGYTDEQAAQW